MKLQPDKSDTQIINAYGPGWVTVGSVMGGTPQLEKVTHSIVIGSRGERLNWPGVGFEQLSAELFDQLAQIRPELIVFGSGTMLRFPSLEAAQAFYNDELYRAARTMREGATEFFNMVVVEGVPGPV